MIIDGIYVLLKGKYIGPEKPGQWALLFEKLGVNVFQLGPLFIVLGSIWLVFLLGLLSAQPWTYMIGILVSILTLWYLPIGTLLSIIVLVILFLIRKDLGI